MARLLANALPGALMIRCRENFASQLLSSSTVSACCRSMPHRVLHAHRSVNLLKLGPGSAACCSPAVYGARSSLPASLSSASDQQGGPENWLAAGKALCSQALTQACGSEARVLHVVSKQK